MNKYIIKNCPLYIPDTEECAEYFDFKMCKDITDCVIKRIVDICKKEKGKGFIMSRYGCKEPISQGYDLACRILKEMEIEECENE